METDELPVLDTNVDFRQVSDYWTLYIFYVYAFDIYVIQSFLHVGSSYTTKTYYCVC